MQEPESLSIRHWTASCSSYVEHTGGSVGEHIENNVYTMDLYLFIFINICPCVYSANRPTHHIFG